MNESNSGSPAPTNAPTEQHFLPYILGEKPQFVITETDQYMAVIEEKPLKEGHCVVFPKAVTDALYDLDDETLAGLMVFAKKIAQAIRAVVPSQKIGIAVIGLQVRHAHIHLVPIHSADDLNFTRPKLEVAEDALVKLATQIKEALL
jgi:histidine triad (HIT) family protein